MPACVVLRRHHDDVVADRDVVPDLDFLGEVQEQWRRDLAVGANPQELPNPPWTVERQAAKNHRTRTDADADRAVYSYADSVERQARAEEKDGICQPETRMKCIEVSKDGANGSRNERTWTILRRSGYRRRARFGAGLFQRHSF
jgi:hypothetical protein